MVARRSAGSIGAAGPASRHTALQFPLIAALLLIDANDASLICPVSHHPAPVVY
jgi:hypothetical protein